MQTDMSEETCQANTEAIDTLITISVVAKVLAVFKILFLGDIKSLE